MRNSIRGQICAADFKRWEDKRRGQSRGPHRQRDPWTRRNAGERISSAREEKGVRRMKKLLSLALAFVMVFSLTVPSAWAADSGDESPVVDGAYQDGTWAQGGYGYTHYENNEGLDLDLSKTAKPVEGSDTEFDVTLEITTRQTKTVTPPGSAATVLVMDVSDSMKDRTDGVARLQSAKKAAMNFIDGTKDQPGYRGEQSGTGRYLAIVKYCGKVTDVLGWVDVSTDAGYKAAVKAIDGLSASAGTNLDVALKHAKTFMTTKDIAEHGENIIHRHSLSAEATKATACSPTHTRMTKLIITRTLVRVAQHFIRLCSLLKFLLRSLIARILIRVILDRLLTISLLYLIGCSCLFNSQHFIIISFLHFLLMFY